MKFGRIVPHVNTHRLAESDFRFDVTLVANASFHTEKCCRLVSDRRIYSSVRQFLIHSTLVYLFSFASLVIFHALLDIVGRAVVFLYTGRPTIYVGQIEWKNMPSLRLKLRLWVHYIVCDFWSSHFIRKMCYVSLRPFMIEKRVPHPKRVASQNLNEDRPILLYARGITTDPTDPAMRGARGPKVWR